MRHAFGSGRRTGTHGGVMVPPGASCPGSSAICEPWRAARLDQDLHHSAHLPSAALVVACSVPFLLTMLNPDSLDQGFASFTYCCKWDLYSHDRKQYVEAASWRNEVRLEHAATCTSSSMPFSRCW